MIGGYEAGKSRVIINDAQEVLGQSVANTFLSPDHELQTFSED
jgi:hypothetical protein